MNVTKQHTLIVVLALLAAILLAGAVFVLRVGEVPQAQAPGVDTPTTTPSETAETATTTPEYPFIDLDPKLHVYKEVELDPEVISINYELKDVTLCGTTYKTKQVIIDGVDVVQRLATILATDERKSEWYCRERYYEVSSNDRYVKPYEELTLIIDQDRRGYSLALYFGQKLPKGVGGYPIWFYPKENQIIGYIGAKFGTFR